MSEPQTELRIPPQDALAERSVLGAMLSGTANIKDVIDTGLTSDHFYFDANKVVFEVITDMFINGVPVDMVTVADKLEKRNRLADAGGVGELMAMADLCLHANYVTDHAQILRETHQRRTLERQLLDMAKAAGDKSNSVAGMLAMIGDTHTKLTASLAGGPIGSHAVIRNMSDVQSVSLEWLWLHRFPLGKISLIAGDPGLGKSFLTCDITARTSCGDRWPDDSVTYQVPGSVMMFNAEDDVADTIRPRLEAAGADLSKVFFVENIESVDLKTGKKKLRGFSLEIDLPYLADWLQATPDARLIVIDPISAYCGQTDSHKNAEVRAMLSPLAELAAKHRVAILCVTHLAKSGGNKAVYRAMGSLAFAAAARAVWSVNRDLEDGERRLLLPAKMNLCKESNGMAYRIVNNCIHWESNPVEMTADDYLSSEAAKSTEKPENRTARNKATEWLRDALKGGERPSKEVFADGKEFGHSMKTLRRAFEEMGGKPRKLTFNGGWGWSLPGQGGHQHDHNPQTKNSGHLGNLRESWPPSGKSSSHEDDHTLTEDGQASHEDDHTKTPVNIEDSEDDHDKCLREVGILGETTF